MAENNQNKNKPIVLILTGPCGAGKTTIAKMITRELGSVYVDGDDIKNKYFPEIEHIDQHPKKLQKVKREILKQAKNQFEKGRNVVVDYILVKEEIEKYKKAFFENLIVRVLLPQKRIISKRDKLRKCWTAGQECVDELYESFYQSRKDFGRENFIDNSNEAPKETYLKHFSHL